MSLRRSIAIAMLAALLLQSAPVSGAPSLTVQPPPNNAIFATSEVDVKGTSSGSFLNWTETSTADFQKGAFCSTLARDGSVSLGNGIYDNFDDNYIDTAKWTLTTHVNVLIAEQDGALRFNYSGYNAPKGISRATATGRAGDRIYADLELKSPLDAASTSFFGMDIDLDATHYIHIWFDCTSGEPYVWVQYTDIVNPNDHQKLKSKWNYVSVEFSLNRAQINVSDVLWVDVHNDCRNATVSLYCLAYQNNYIDAAWDNVSIGQALEGTYTSAVKDTGASLTYLKSCGWTSQTPAGTAVKLQYRSSASPSMADSSAWADLTAGNIGGKVAVNRYFQYRALLTSGDISVTPRLDDVSFSHYVPVEKVEVSADGGKSWVAATGTDSWSAKVPVPEGRHDLMVRATDYAGGLASATVTVIVDLTKPAGTITINDGAVATDSTEVNLTLGASDANGVTDMRISEDPNLEGADWSPFSAGMQFSLSPDEGNKTVHAQFRDKAGWMSEIVSDSIFLDFTPPVGTVLINGGAEYTNGTEVGLNITAYDLQGVASMQIANDPGFAGASWQDFRDSLEWSLLPGNGERTVYARFRTETLQTSKTVSDRIILDTIPPTVNASINNGAGTTNSPSIQVQLDASDNNIVSRMQLSENPTFTGADILPFEANTLFQLSAGDGEKSLFVRVWDAAGNEETATPVKITLDTAPPVVNISPLPPTLETPTIALSWEASDATTGVASFDVEYRSGTVWTAFLKGFRANNTKFTGTEGNVYYFRVRAVDRAGNAGQFAEAGPVTIVKPDLTPPTIDIKTPAKGAYVKGSITASGSSHHPVLGRSVEKVQVSLDKGEWADANGTASWSFTINTKSLPDGKHSLRARAYDGRTYSMVAEANFTVKNAERGASGAADSNLVMIGVAAVLIVAVAIAGFVFIRKRKANGS
jgi:hypothetical protein